MPANDFEKHWQESVDVEIPPSKITAAQRFLTPLFDRLGNEKRVTILDAGCGDGVHLKTILENARNHETWRLFAVDLSRTALKKVSTNYTGQVDLFQSDVGHLPFKDAQFDAVFSFGVIAYTQHPEQAFSELCRVTHRGGLVGVWLYPKKRGLAGLAFSVVRSLCKLTGSIGTRVIADLIVPFLGFLPTESKVNLSNASWKQCREVVLVNIAPKQLYFPEQAEVTNWFHRNGYKLIHEDPEHAITLWGEKQS